MAVTLRDLARWGQMCVNDGAVNGQQVVPVAFFQDIRKNASVEKLAHSPLLGRLMPAGVGYRSLFYHQRESGDAFAAAGAYGQFCYMNPKYDTVVAMFSTTPPWTAEVATGAPFDVIFERDCRRERERWHLCHEMARILS